MKKILFIITLLIFTIISNAQNKLESNHSIGINLLGFEYAYEQVLGKKITIVGTAEISSTLGYSSWSGTYFCIAPILSATPRFYYNMETRERKGKTITLNSVNYLALGTGYVFKKPLYKTNNVENISSAVIIFPHWGMRRVYNNRWLLEFNAGLNLSINSYHEYHWNPGVGFKFGIIL